MEEHVQADLVNRLEQRFGMKPEELHDVTLSAGGEDLVVSLRLPLYDDLIWAVAVITEELEQGQNIGVVQTDVQRERLLQHLSSVRCVVKIEGEWLWEIFNMGPAIKELSPGWSGESMITVPDFFQGTMAKQVWRLFRHRLHPDLLFDLNRKVENLLAERGPAKEKEADEQEKESDDPTDAA